MRLKELFTVPVGQKVTEKALRRVLASSLCSILLCLVCLVSTTWAWFAVSIENTGNTIAIAEITPTITVKENNIGIAPTDGIYTLKPGNYTITVALEQARASAYGSQPPVYAVMTVQESEGASQCYYFAFADRTEQQTQKMTVNSNPVTVSFSASWVKPANADSAGGEPMFIGDAPVTEPTTEPTTEETAAQTDPPTETTEPTTEAIIQPATEPTVEPATESSVEPSAPAPSVEETTNPEEING